MVGDDVVNSAKELTTMTESGDKTIESVAPTPTLSKMWKEVIISMAKLKKLNASMVSNQSDHSMATSDIIDAEVRELVERAYARAKTLMETHIEILHKLATLLLEKETIDGEEFLSLFIDGKAELYVN